jgi:hypothetical protein
VIGVLAGSAPASVPHVGPISPSTPSNPSMIR